MNISSIINSDNSSIELDWEDLMRKYNPQNDPTYWRQKIIKNSLIIISYSIIFIISLFGNSLVCYIIFSTRQLRTVTNYYIANLTVSDLMMTLINIPFTIARLLLDDWPFGELLCKCVPFVQACSVYVSTITMCIIGLDRHQAIVHPFGKRLSAIIPIKVIIPLIWLTSSLFSIPHAYFNEVVKLPSVNRYLTRCRIEYPEPQTAYRQWLTIITFTSQYVVPLSIATVCYCKIAYNIHKRGMLGAMTQQQIVNSTRTNRKTIKMLIVVLVVFAICWLPLNLFHIILDFGLVTSRHSFTIFLFVHWFAMSSVCYNPFIYSIRNSYFRKGVKNFFSFIFCRCQQVRQNNSNQSRDISNTHLTSLHQNSKRVQQPFDCYSDENTINMSPEIMESKQTEEFRFTKSHKWLLIWKSDSCNETQV